jgi:hypothetical protein
MNTTNVVKQKADYEVSIENSTLEGTTKYSVILLYSKVNPSAAYSASGYYEAQFCLYPFPILTFETVCVPHSRRKCCITEAKSIRQETLCM